MSERKLNPNIPAVESSPSVKGVGSVSKYRRSTEELLRIVQEGMVNGERCEREQTDGNNSNNFSFSLEEQLLFTRVQFDTMIMTGTAHKRRDVGISLARLQKRISSLEAHSGEKCS